MSNSKLLSYYILTIATVYLLNSYKRFSIAEVLEASTHRFCFPYRAVLFIRTSQSMLISLAPIIESNYRLLTRTATCVFAAFFLPLNFCECLFTLFVGLLVIISFSLYLNNCNYLLCDNIVLNTAIMSFLAFCYLGGCYYDVNYVATTHIIYKWL